MVIQQLTNRFYACVAVLLLAGRGGVPKYMQVRDGISPSNIDKNVRFRTTYYFRAFDWCYGKGLLDDSDEVLILPESDTLYRFVMTGKAHSLTTKVNFESGTLTAAQIDPFGAKAIYDKGIDGFRFASQQEIHTKARQSEALERLDQLLARYARIDDNELKPELRSALTAAIRRAITEYSGYSVLEPEEEGSKGKADTSQQPSSTFESAIQGAKLNAKQTEIVKNAFEKVEADGIQCPKNVTVRRGFQILGPEGWRTFNQDERLLMAMSTSASPLIGTLQEYSSRLLDAKSDTTNGLLLLVREQARTLRAEREAARNELAGEYVDVLFRETLGGFDDVAD